jgi:hypothetical protein
MNNKQNVDNKDFSVNLYLFLKKIVSILTTY